MDKEELKKLIRERALKVSKEPIFRLSSGKLSRYYVDLKSVTFEPKGAFLVGKLMYYLVKPFKVKAVGGLTLGADPIAYSLSLYAYLNGDYLKPFVVRKEKKEHGTKRKVEGILERGERVAVLEDVITTGSSSLKAVKACKELGLEVVGVFAVVDRQEGGEERLREEGLRLYSLFKLKELL